MPRLKAGSRVKFCLVLFFCLPCFCCVFSQNDLFEPNNTFDEAKTIALNKPVTITLAPKGDEDIFNLYFKEAGYVIFTLENIPNNIYPDVNFFDSKNKQVISPMGQQKSQTALEKVYTVDKGEYFVSIKDYYKRFPGSPLTLTASHIPLGSKGDIALSFVVIGFGIKPGTAADNQLKQITKAGAGVYFNPQVEEQDLELSFLKAVRTLSGKKVTFPDFVNLALSQFYDEAIGANKPLFTGKTVASVLSEAVSELMKKSKRIFYRHF